MSHLDSVELSSKMLNINPNQLIIIMSAQNEQKQIGVFLSMRIDKFFLKPVQNYDLLSSLEKLSKLTFLKVINKN